MYNFQSYLQELSAESAIRFKLSFLEGGEIFNSLEEVKESDFITEEISLDREIGTLSLEKENEKCASLLKFSIEKKYNELHYYREQLIIDMLQGKGVAYEVYSNTFPFLAKSSTLFLIAVEGSSVDALGTIKELYEEEKAIALIYKDVIVVLGNFVEPEDHAKGMIDAISSELFAKVYISYIDMPEENLDIKGAYEEAREAMDIGRMYAYKNVIFNREKMLLEKAVYSIAPKAKKEILRKLEGKLSELDKDMINTLEEFISSGLNISEAAKRLYVHRNTLIYRLEKLSRDTGYDVREFKQAIIFTIAFLLWKEERE